MSLNILRFLICNILVVIVCGSYLDDFEITCKDENGKNVDWYYLYKLPGQFDGVDKTKQCMYLFITSNSPEEQWILSNHTLNDVESFAGQTLSQAYFDSEKFNQTRLLIAYNDEPPNKKPNSSKGHLKGVVVADERSGFWLVHSVPLYPNISSNSNEYHYPPTGLIYGQSYLCLSLSAEQINNVGKQLIYNEPQIYEEKFPQHLRNIYPNIEKLLQGKRIQNAPYWNEIDLKTLNQNVFKSFAKSSKFQKELYEDWIAPTLNTNLYVETWRKGPGNLASNCSLLTRVWNISKMNLMHAYEFPTTDDHSKWAVSDQSSSWICVGDINRAEKQLQRGGGSICHQSKPISGNYRSSIADFEPCR